MDSTGLSEVYDFDPETIEALEVSGKLKNEIGVFAIGILGEDGQFIFQRVAKSETNDMRDYLKDHLPGGNCEDEAKDCKKFKFHSYPSAAKAFEIECYIYHKHKKTLKYNYDHPHRPKLQPRLRCSSKTCPTNKDLDKR